VIVLIENGLEIDQMTWPFQETEFQAVGLIVTGDDEVHDKILP